MTIRGSCLCGGVRFEIDRAVGPFEICHCHRCRKVSGSIGMPGVGVNTADRDSISDDLPQFTLGEIYRHRTGNDLPDDFEVRHHGDHDRGEVKR